MGGRRGRVADKPACLAAARWPDTDGGARRERRSLGGDGGGEGGGRDDRGKEEEMEGEEVEEEEVN